MQCAADRLLSEIVEEFYSSVGGHRTIGEIYVGGCRRRPDSVGCLSDQPHPLDAEASKPGTELAVRFNLVMRDVVDDSASRSRGFDPLDVTWRGVTSDSYDDPLDRTVAKQVRLAEEIRGIVDHREFGLPPVVVRGSTCRFEVDKRLRHPACRVA